MTLLVGSLFLGGYNKINTDQKQNDNRGKESVKTIGDLLFKNIHMCNIYIVTAPIPSPPNISLSVLFL